MSKVTTIGIDLAKQVFQVHGVDASGVPVLRVKLRRGQVHKFFADLDPCLVGMEACSTANHWARELIALGHEVRLMPPQYVKAYVKRNKNDAADAEAICEAVVRPTMRFVPLKSVEQQGVLVMHRARDLLIRQRTMLINALRSHLAEFGIIEAKGLEKAARLVAIVSDPSDARVPELAREALKIFAALLEALAARVAAIEARIMAWHKHNPLSRRLATVPGIGPITATALAATIPDGSVFRSGREFAAWLGLVPRQNSTGGKARLGGISKRGDRYLRRLLISGARSALLFAKAIKTHPWVVSLLARRPPFVVAVALANKLARICWAVMMREDGFHADAVAA